jgi:hypothetical protein
MAMQSMLYIFSNSEKVEFIYFFFYFNKKTLIATGEGLCASVGSSNNTAFYCGTGPDCNNFESRNCWYPQVGAATANCGVKDWQCKVCISFV